MERSSQFRGSEINIQPRDEREVTATVKKAGAKQKKAKADVGMKKSASKERPEASVG